MNRRTALRGLAGLAAGLCVAPLKAASPSYTKLDWRPASAYMGQPCWDGYLGTRILYTLCEHQGTPGMSTTGEYWWFGQPHVSMSSADGSLHNTRHRSLKAAKAAAMADLKSLVAAVRP